MIDVTAKTGLAAFAPQWEYIWAYKTKQLSEDAYRARYAADMAQSMRDHPEDWQRLLAMEEVALACYCSPDQPFCHRWQLRDILIIEHHRHGDEAIAAGELA